MGSDLLHHLRTSLWGLSAGEGYGADLLECRHTAHTGQPGDRAQSARVHESPVLISFYDKVTRLVDVVYLAFSKAFDTVSHSLLLEKLTAHGLDGHTPRWVKN